MNLKDYTKAVVSFCGTSGWGVCKDEDGVFTVTYSDDYEGVQPTHEELVEKAEELKISTAYIDARIYPSIQEQLDMQYWDSVNGTTTWADAIAAVKAANPKPE
jgi:ketopantoate reductase